VGGSGFYLRALTEGMYPSSTVPEEIRKKSDDLYLSAGITPFWELLEKVDLDHFQKLAANDHYRIRRAIEHWWCHTTPFSQAQKLWEQQKSAHSLQNLLPIDTVNLYLDLPKSEHWAIILERTKSMIQAGLIEEVKNLLNTYTGLERPLQSIGYKETQSYLQGESPKSEEELIELIYLATRQLAKSQRTWFQKIPKESFHPQNDKEKIFAYLQNFFYDE
jgi:tRNA dimethylallyltransferase